MKTEKAQERIREAIKKHGKGFLQFSGGKDSLAVLHLCRPFNKDVTVLFGDTGDAYPHVFEFAHEICDCWGFELRIVRPETSVLDYVQTHGLPADIVPVWSTPMAAQFLPEHRKPSVYMQSGIDCCSAMLWTPLHLAVVEGGRSLVFRGSKGTDQHTTAPDGLEFEGIEYVSPLWGWTDDDVLTYLRESDVELPMQYKHGCNHSLDCMECTAWGDTQAEHQRIAFTKQFYPREALKWRHKMIAIRNETIRQLEAVEPFINLAEED